MITFFLGMLSGAGLVWALSSLCMARNFSPDDWWYLHKWQLIAWACDQKWIPKDVMQFVLTRVS